MKHLTGLLMFFVCGCSNSPVAGFLDFAFPPRKIPPNTRTFGGVNGPQPAPPSAAVPGTPFTPSLPPTNPVLPGLPVPGASEF